MRLKDSVVVLLIAIVAASTVPLTGQEEPLPAIQPKTPEVVLAVVPFHDVAQPTLAEAVRANDFATFDALYRSAPVPAFAMLHELWTFSMNDPVGAFYGPELRDRIARAYPGFSEYIEQFRIIDSNGNVFYPTSETRVFLLDRAIEGRAPRVLLAEEATRTRVPRSVGAPASPPAGSAASRRRVAAPKPEPTQTAARDAAVPAGEDAGAPLAAAPPAPAPVVVATPAPVVPATVVQQPNDFGSRGILLLVIGLIGIGILAMMLRAPREEPPATIIQPPQPITRPSAAPPPSQPQESAKNRATGSHG